LLQALGSSGDAHTVANFIAWGYSDSFRVFIGVCELLGAISLVIPPFTTLGASGLSVVMLGAVFTHLAHDQAPFAPIPLVLLVIVLHLAYAAGAILECCTSMRALLTGKGGASQVRGDLASERALDGSPRRWTRARIPAA
jgi:hypothetical protein